MLYTNLLPSVKVGSKLTYLVAKIGGHVIAHLPSVQVVVRFKTKQNPIWSKALTMPLTIWNYVKSYKQSSNFEGKICIYFPGITWGWSGGAMVLGKLSVPGRPTYFHYSRARAYCACSRCGWGMFGHFFSRLSFLSSFWETARYRLKYCMKGPLNSKQPTNQPTNQELL